MTTRTPVPPTSSTLELLSWVARRPRSYSDAMEAWRSHCPRLTTWEDTLLDGFIAVQRPSGPAPRSMVVVTPRGRAALDSNLTGGPDGVADR